MYTIKIQTFSTENSDNSNLHKLPTDSSAYTSAKQESNTDNTAEKKKTKNKKPTIKGELNQVYIIF